MKILIVDDNHDNLYMLETLLKGSGYQTALARNGEEALSLLRSEGAGLIISDIFMPQMDGFQLCREVRADEELRHIPFIFYTATYTSEQDEKFALSLGADRFVLKPTEPAEFLAIMQGVLRDAPTAKEAPGAPAMKGEEYLQEYTTRLKEKLEYKAAQVRETEWRYRNLFYSLRDVVIICDLEGVVVDANQPALRNTLGYELEDLQGSPWTALCQACASLFADTAEDGVVLEATLRRRDNSTFEAEVSRLELIGDDGHRAGTICLIRDVSAQKMLEAQLMQAQKMEAIGRLAGGVAHDFNNKLTVINGVVQLLKRRRPQWEEMEKMLDMIVTAAKQSRDITRQLLTFSRRDVIAPREIDLNAAIEHGCASLGPLIGEDVRIELSLSPGLWHTRLDPTQVDQIVMNLAVNASDAMPRGGKLCFATSNVTLPEALVQERPGIRAGDYLQLTVSDTGVGIEPEALGHIFEPFFTTKERGKGTGLGLSTTYGIVTQNGGSITVSSRPGHGTCFTILLPRCTGGVRVAEGERCRAVAPAREDSGAILLVEDDDAVRQITMKMLQNLGYSVIEKAGPEEAISCCDGEVAVDLVLTDVVMPVMNGKDMMREISARKPGVPVIYMSGYLCEKATADLDLDEGTHFIRKPFDIESLRGKIRSVLQGGPVE